MIAAAEGPICSACLKQESDATQRNLALRLQARQTADIAQIAKQVERSAKQVERIARHVRFLAFVTFLGLLSVFLSALLVSGST